MLIIKDDESMYFRIINLLRNVWGEGQHEPTCVEESDVPHQSG